MLGLVQLPVVRELTGRSWQWPAITASVMVLGGGIAAVLRAAGLGDDLSQPIGVAGLSVVTGIVLSGWINQTRTTSTSGNIPVPMS